MNRVQHNEVLMRVKEEDLRLLTEEENKRQPIVKNFLSSDDETARV